ncbi:hypothetical protein [Vulcanisaeta sp. JCM 16159]|uniref:hypothetical protein n=1 Tax=Vulcanisaeta sp. JCM 16159 TaxID=1295371 RepID=UPI0006D27DDE|nr:hypothetical protein [Vulcanisaeta sp. JCM 16159]
MGRFRAYYDDGIVVEYENSRFVIDPLKKPVTPFNAVLITHGHRDHVNPRVLYNVSPLIMSDETAKIIRLVMVITSGTSLLVQVLGSLLIMSWLNPSMLVMWLVVYPTCLTLAISGLELREILMWSLNTT